MKFFTKFAVAILFATSFVADAQGASVVFPTGAPRVGGAVSQHFGRGYDATHTGHLGTDFAPSVRGRAGDPVVAIDDGVVTHVAPAGAWQVVIIQHPSGVCSLYGHVVPGVVNGQRVLRGQPIAAIGPVDKFSTGVHLHLEIRSGKDAATKAGPGYFNGGNFNRADFPTKTRDNITWWDAHAYLTANLIAFDQVLPTVQIVNPRAGTYRNGQQMQFTFINSDANGISHVWVELHKGNQRVGFIRQAAPFTGDYAAGVWTVPNNLPAGNDYRLKVVAFDNSPEHNGGGSFSPYLTIRP